MIDCKQCTKETGKSGCSKIPKLRRFVLQNFPFIEKDFDALTDYALLCKVVEYLNQVIKSQNCVVDKMNEVVELFEQLRDFVNNYFDNLDVQEEINNKIEDMIISGEFQNIMSEITMNTNFFFMAGFDQRANNKTRYFVSGDGVNFNEINISKNFAGRDISLVYNKHNQTFYCTYTTASETSSVKIWTSKDLNNWVEHTPTINGLYTTGRTWAPDLFVDDNGDLYVTVSSQYGTEVDIRGDVDIPAFDIFIAKCNNIDELTFDDAYKVELPSETRNHIDSNIVKVNNTYYLDVKNEYNKKTEVYSSTDLQTFTLMTQDLVGASLWVEGNQLVPFQDKILYMADCYQDQIFITSATDVNDFPMFNNRFNICEGLKTGEIRIRHGSCIYVDDYYAKSKIWNREGFNLGASSTANKINVRKTINVGTQPYYLENYAPIPNSFINLAGSQNFNISIKNIFNVPEFKFCFGASDDVKMTVTKIDNTTLATPLVITNNRTINEKIQSINLITPSVNRYLMDDIQGNIITSADNLVTISDNYNLINNRLYLTRLNGTVWFHIQVQKKAGYAGAENDTICTLPTGYRPYITTLVNVDRQGEALGNVTVGNVTNAGLVRINSTNISATAMVTGCWLGLK